MREISRARFDAFAGFCRKPELRLFGEEISWFQSSSGDVLSALIIDTDREFSGVILARDLRERFRWVGQTNFVDRPDLAVSEIETTMQQVEVNLEEERVQGDDSESAVDFFMPIVAKERLNQSFLSLTSSEAYSAARRLIEIMMRWYDDSDGNFIEQFQTSGFDARIWELYLWAMLVETGYVVSHPNPAPDFLAEGLSGEFVVEATTINPTIEHGRVVPPPQPTTEQEVVEYARNYLPIRYAGPLTAKLKKRYWVTPMRWASH